MADYADLSCEGDRLCDDKAPSSIAETDGDDEPGHMPGTESRDDDPAFVSVDGATGKARARATPKDIRRLSNRTAQRVKRAQTPDDLPELQQLGEDMLRLMVLTLMQDLVAAGEDHDLMLQDKNERIMELEEEMEQLRNHLHEGQKEGNHHGEVVDDLEQEIAAVTARLHEHESTMTDQQRDIGWLQEKLEEQASRCSRLQKEKEEQCEILEKKRNETQALLSQLDAAMKKHEPPKFKEAVTRVAFSIKSKLAAAQEEKCKKRLRNLKYLHDSLAREATDAHEAPSAPPVDATAGIANLVVDAGSEWAVRLQQSQMQTTKQLEKAQELQRELANKDQQIAGLRLVLSMRKISHERKISDMNELLDAAKWKGQTEECTTAHPRVEVCLGDTDSDQEMAPADKSHCDSQYTCKYEKTGRSCAPASATEQEVVRERQRADRFQKELKSKDGRLEEKEKEIVDLRAQIVDAERQPAGPVGCEHAEPMCLPVGEAPGQAGLADLRNEAARLLNEINQLECQSGELRRQKDELCEVLEQSKSEGERVLEQLHEKSPRRWKDIAKGVAHTCRSRRATLERNEMQKRVRELKRAHELWNQACAPGSSFTNVVEISLQSKELLAVRVHQLEVEVTEEKARAEQLEQDVKSKDGRVGEKERVIVALHAQIGDLEGQLAEIMGRAPKKPIGLAIGEAPSQSDVAAFQKEASRLMDEISQRDGTIEALREELLQLLKQVVASQEQSHEVQRQNDEPVKLVEQSQSDAIEGKSQGRLKYLASSMAYACKSKKTALERDESQKRLRALRHAHELWSSDGAPRSSFADVVELSFETKEALAVRVHHLQAEVAEANAQAEQLQQGLKAKDGRLEEKEAMIVDLNAQIGALERHVTEPQVRGQEEPIGLEVGEETGQSGVAEIQMQAARLMDEVSQREGAFAEIREELLQFLKRVGASPEQSRQVQRQQNELCKIAEQSQPEHEKSTQQSDATPPERKSKRRLKDLATSMVYVCKTRKHALERNESQKRVRALKHVHELWSRDCAPGSSFTNVVETSLEGNEELAVRVHQLQIEVAQEKARAHQLQQELNKKENERHGETEKVTELYGEIVVLEGQLEELKEHSRTPAMGIACKEAGAQSRIAELQKEVAKLVDDILLRDGNVKKLGQDIGSLSKQLEGSRKQSRELQRQTEEFSEALDRTRQQGENLKQEADASSVERRSQRRLKDVATCLAYAFKSKQAASGREESQKRLRALRTVHEYCSRSCAAGNSTFADVVEKTLESKEVLAVRVHQLQVEASREKTRAEQLQLDEKNKDERLEENNKVTAALRAQIAELERDYEDLKGRSCGDSTCIAVDEADGQSRIAELSSETARFVEKLGQEIILLREQLETNQEQNCDSPRQKEEQYKALEQTQRRSENILHQLGALLPKQRRSKTRLKDVAGFVAYVVKSKSAALDRGNCHKRLRALRTLHELWRRDCAPGNPAFTDLVEKSLEGKEVLAVRVHQLQMEASKEKSRAEGLQLSLNDKDKQLEESKSVTRGLQAQIADSEKVCEALQGRSRREPVCVAADAAAEQSRSVEHHTDAAFLDGVKQRDRTILKLSQEIMLLQEQLKANHENCCASHRPEGHDALSIESRTWPTSRTVRFDVTDGSTDATDFTAPSSCASRRSIRSDDQPEFPTVESMRSARCAPKRGGPHITARTVSQERQAASIEGLTELLQHEGVPQRSMVLRLLKDNQGLLDKVDELELVVDCKDEKILKLEDQIEDAQRNVGRGQPRPDYTLDAIDHLEQEIAEATRQCQEKDGAEEQQQQDIDLLQKKLEEEFAKCVQFQSEQKEQCEQLERKMRQIETRMHQLDLASGKRDVVPTCNKAIATLALSMEGKLSAAHEDQSKKRVRNMKHLQAALGGEVADVDQRASSAGESAPGLPKLETDTGSELRVLLRQSQLQVANEKERADRMEGELASKEKLLVACEDDVHRLLEQRDEKDRILLDICSQLMEQHWMIEQFRGQSLRISPQAMFAAVGQPVFRGLNYETANVLARLKEWDSFIMQHRNQIVHLRSQLEAEADQCRGSRTETESSARSSQSPQRWHEV